MKIKTSESIGAPLDWAVAKCVGEEVWMHKGQLETRWTANGWKPSADWSQGGQIIEREVITVSPANKKAIDYKEPWCAYYLEVLFDDCEGYYATGTTPLIAAMRALVARKLGDEFEVAEGWA